MNSKLQASSGQAKKVVLEAVRSLKERISSIVEDLYHHPETALQEHRTSSLLCDFLEEAGYRIERGIAGMPTAFRAEWGTGEPAIAILAEMDALPEMGHACGHNVIAAAAAGAAVALCRAVPPGAGRIVVLGTPAEETGTGKTELVRHGYFREIDAAMMVHPSSRRTVSRQFLGLVRISFVFTGKAAHAAAYPFEGVNALDGVIVTFNAVNALRQQLRDEVRVHGIITDGGQVPNIIPERAAAYFYVRAPEMDELAEVRERVIACAQGAALATGTSLEIRIDDRILSPFRINDPFVQVYREQLALLGLAEELATSGRGRGSSDIGNVSQVVPTIHPHVPLGPGLHIHTPEFARATVSPAGFAAAAEGASAMALTAVELLFSPQKLAEVKQAYGAA